MLPADVSWLPPRQHLQVEKCCLFKTFFLVRDLKVILISYLCGTRNKVDDKNEKPKEVLRHWVSRKRKVCVRSRDFAISVKFVILMLNRLCSMKPSAFLRDCHKYKYFVSCYTFPSYNLWTISPWHDLSKDTWVWARAVFKTYTRTKEFYKFLGL